MKNHDDACEPEKEDFAAALQRIWSELLEDRDASRALQRLKKDGFEISHREPHAATSRQPCWAEHIAAIPLVSNRPSRRQIHRKATLLKHRSLVRAMRELAQRIDDPFSEVSIRSTTDYACHEIATLGKKLVEAAEFVEKFLSWNWYVRDRNQRNALIAELRWEIRRRTGKPHDLELATLIDAAFRAAGAKDGFYIDPPTLDRIEKREKEGRMKATGRLRSLVT